MNRLALRILSIPLLVYHLYFFIRSLCRSFLLNLDYFFSNPSVPFKLLYPLAESLPNNYLLNFLLQNQFFRSSQRNILFAEYTLANSYLNNPLDYLENLGQFQNLESNQLPSAVIFGFYHQNFGHLSLIDLYARAKSIGLETRPFFFIKNSRSIANNELLEIISSSYEIPIIATSRISFSELNSTLSDSVANIYSFSLSHYPSTDFYSGCNYIYHRTCSRNPIAHLSSDQILRARACLSSNSLDNDSQFVVIHVRSSRVTSKQRSGADSCLEDYIPTILYLVSTGYDIFILDSAINHDHSLLSLLPTGKVNFVHDFLCYSSIVDIYLLSSCHFMIGTASGPLTVPPMFGRPVLYTNCPSLGHMFRLPRSRCIPHTFTFCNSTNRAIPLSHLLTTSAPYTVSPSVNGLLRCTNQPDLILSSTIEFIHDVVSTHEESPPSSLQSDYLDILSNYHPKPSMTGMLPTNAFLSSFPEFLH